MFEPVSKFESLISEYFGSPYAVATDCCTHAIELCLTLKNVKETKCPNHTYISVPMTLKKLNVNWSWYHSEWENYYQFTNTDIIDAAVLWKEKSYIPGTMMCLSFQFRKHLSLGRGGMILLDNLSDRNQLIKMSYDGRLRNIPWASQNIDTLGYHYYMTPEIAQLGIEKLDKAKIDEPRIWSYRDYPDLEKFPIFNKTYAK